MYFKNVIVFTFYGCVFVAKASRKRKHNDPKSKNKTTHYIFYGRVIYMLWIHGYYFAAPSDDDIFFFSIPLQTFQWKTAHLRDTESNRNLAKTKPRIVFGSNDERHDTMTQDGHLSAIEEMQAAEAIDQAVFTLLVMRDCAIMIHWPRPTWFN